MDFADLASQAASLTSTEPDLIANMANIAALLFHAMNKAKADSINWLGFYRVVAQRKELVLGPFQGEVACLRIPFEAGVCGACATSRAPVRVDDVHSFPGHIACDSASQSELVVPVFDEKMELIGVLDIDASVKNCFSAEDEEGMVRVMREAFSRPTPPTPPPRKIKHATKH